MLALNIKDWQKQVDLELKKKTPIFLYHGTDDPMIQHEHAKMTYGLLDKHGLNYKLTSEKGLEHSLSMDEIVKVREFLAEHMK
jgi:predicted esterase